MRSTMRCLCALLAIGAFCASAMAQSASDASLNGGATTLTAFAGASAGDSSVQPVLGAGAGWRVTPRVSVEGTGLWASARSGGSAFAAAVKSEVALTSSQRASPFVQAGIGLYRARFDDVDRPIPSFYRRRLAESSSTAGAQVTFTDPTVVFGGGVNIRLNRRLTTRPDIESQVAVRSSHTYVMTTVRIHLVYYFENHPVTPSHRHVVAGPR